MRKFTPFLFAIAMAGAGFAFAASSASARTYDQCVEDEYNRLAYALPGEGSKALRDTAEAMCGGRPKERGANAQATQASKRRAQKLNQDSCLGQKHGFRCNGD